MASTEALNVSSSSINAAAAAAGVGRDESSPEGLVLAYGSLILMSLVPIVLGSWRSVRQKRPRQPKTPATAAPAATVHQHASSGGGGGLGRDSSSRSHHTSRSRSSPRHHRSDSDDHHHRNHHHVSQPPTSSSHATTSPLNSTSKSDVLRLVMHASIVVLLCCLICKFFSRNIIILGLKVYVYVLGSLALAHSISPICHLLVPSSVPNVSFHILFIKGDGPQRRSLINYKFTTYDIICLLLSVSIGFWYLLQKHWIPNNMLGLACSISSIELLQLNNVVTGYIMMIIYYLDTVCFSLGQHFWESLATSIDLPILILFPKNVADGGGSSGAGSTTLSSHHHPSANDDMMPINYALFDVADIVIPGLFLALMLRFDQSNRAAAAAAAASGPSASSARKLNVYFYATLLGYVAGIVLAWSMLIVFRCVYTTTAFVVPGCLLPPVLVALRLGDVKLFFSYDDAVPVAVAAAAPVAGDEAEAGEPEPELGRERSRARKRA